MVVEDFSGSWYRVRLRLSFHRLSRLHCSQVIAASYTRGKMSATNISKKRKVNVGSRLSSVVDRKAGDEVELGGCSQGAAVGTASVGEGVKTCRGNGRCRGSKLSSLRAVKGRHV